MGMPTDDQICPGVGESPRSHTLARLWTMGVLHTPVSHDDNHISSLIERADVRTDPAQRRAI